MTNPFRAHLSLGRYFYAAACAIIFIIVRIPIAESSNAAAIQMRGWISDANCGVQHAGFGGKDCVKKCLKGGAHVGHPEWAPQSMVFINAADQKVWTVKDPVPLKGYEGEFVIVSALPDAGTGSLEIQEVLPFREPGNRKLFTFQNGFWINLHHFLRGEARRILHPETMPEVRFNPVLSQEEVKSWNAAMDYYKVHFAEKDLVFDKELWKIKNVLSTAANAEALTIEDQELAGILMKAAPVYRKHWWPIHKESNDSWISTATRMVAQFGPHLADRLSASYGSAWPDRPVGVDVTIEAGWAGAYTTENPVHITISSSEPRLQDYAALEMLFHEASHAWDSILAKEIKKLANQNKIAPPPDLWHALIFYTAGELTRSELSKVQIPNYVPYAYVNKNYERGWQQYECALKRYWQPFLENPSDPETALEQVVLHSHDCKQ